MAGSGSGYRWSKKARVEGCTTLDTSDLNRMKLLIPGTNNRSGSLEWRRGGQTEPSSTVGYLITVGETSGSLRLDYQMTQTKEKFDYAIPLVATCCHLGGRRWWFICPLVRGGVACNRRVRKVYLRGKYFGCRRCHNLAYMSSQESDSRVYAALRRGAHLHEFGNVTGMSISQLGFALKVLTAGQKRLDRIGKRINRDTRRRGPK